MKIRSSIKIMCKGCQSIRRGKQRIIQCSLQPKHKQRQG